MIVDVAKRSGHTAAASVELDDGRSRNPTQKRLGRSDAAHRLLVTVAVKQNAGWPAAEIEPRSRGLTFTFEKLFEEHRPVGHNLRAPLRVTPEQRGDILANRRETT